MERRRREYREFLWCHHPLAFSAMNCCQSVLRSFVICGRVGVGIPFVVCCLLLIGFWTGSSLFLYKLWRKGGKGQTLTMPPCLLFFLFSLLPNPWHGVNTAAVMDEATVREQENEKRRWSPPHLSSNKSFLPWVICWYWCWCQPHQASTIYVLSVSLSPLSSLPYPIPFAIHFSTILSFNPLSGVSERGWEANVVPCCRHKWNGEMKKRTSSVNKRSPICSRILEQKWKQSGRCGYRITHHSHTLCSFGWLFLCVPCLLLFFPVCEAMQRRSVWSIRSLGCLCWWWWSRKYWWRRSFVLILISDNGHVPIDEVRFLFSTCEGLIDEGKDNSMWKWENLNALMCCDWIHLNE